jgi:hypothetical protein
MDWEQAAEYDVPGDNHLTMGSAMEEQGKIGGKEKEEEKMDDGNGQIGQIERPWTF